MADNLSNVQLAVLEEAFSLFDDNGDGTIHYRDLGAIVRSLDQNPTDAELGVMLREVDRNGSGAIHFPDFRAMMARRMQTSSSSGSGNAQLAPPPPQNDLATLIANFKGTFHTLDADLVCDIVTSMRSKGSTTAEIQAQLSLMSSVSPPPDNSQAQQQNGDQEGMGKQESSDVDGCIICMNGPRNTALVPCGHRSFCGTCAAAVEILRSSQQYLYLTSTQ